MSPKTDTEVIIGGKVFTLSGYESEDYMQKIASYINGKITEYGKLDGFRRQPLDKQNILLQLNIADDYFKAKKQISILEEELQGKEKELYDLKHELISLKMQMEEEKPEAQPEQNTRHIETDEEIDGSLKATFKELLGEDSDGQMSMMTNEKNMIEHQITGQMTIEEVLSEWEKMRKAAEAALEDARKRKLESAKARALQEAGDIMDRLTGVLPKLDAVLAEKADIVEETTETPPQTPERETPPATNEPEERKEEEEENKKEEQPARDTDAEELWPEGVSLEEMVRSQQKKKTEAAAQKPAEETSDVTGDTFAKVTFSACSYFVHPCRFCDKTTSHTDQVCIAVSEDLLSNLRVTDISHGDTWLAEFLSDSFRHIGTPSVFHVVGIDLILDRSIQSC